MKTQEDETAAGQCSQLQIHESKHQKTQTTKAITKKGINQRLINISRTQSHNIKKNKKDILT